MLNNDRATTGIPFETNTFCDDELSRFVIASVLECTPLEADMPSVVAILVGSRWEACKEVGRTLAERWSWSHPFRLRSPRARQRRRAAGSSPSPSQHAFVSATPEMLARPKGRKMWLWR